jgi:hypothetical protein
MVIYKFKYTEMMQGLLDYVPALVSGYEIVRGSLDLASVLS